MMQLEFDYSIPIILVGFTMLLIVGIFRKKSPLVRITGITGGLLMLGVITFAVVIYLIASVFSSVGGVAIGTDKLPGIIIVTVLVVGIVSFILYDWILKSRLGYSAAKLIGG